MRCGPHRCSQHCLVAWAHGGAFFPIPYGVRSAQANGHPSLMDRSHLPQHPTSRRHACSLSAPSRVKAAHKTHVGASAVSGALVMLYSELSTSTTTSAAAHSDRPAPKVEAKTACDVLCPQPVLCARSIEFALITPASAACPQAVESESIRSGATCPAGSNKAEESAWRSITSLHP